MFFTTGLEKSYSSVALYHPSKIAPSFVGFVGFVTLFPTSIVCLATSLPPLLSKIIVRVLGRVAGTESFLQPISSTEVNPITTNTTNIFLCFIQVS